MPFWKATSQSLNYIPDNFIALRTNGTWVRNLWQASRVLDKGYNASGYPNVGTDWVRIPLDVPLATPVEAHQK